MNRDKIKSLLLKALSEAGMILKSTLHERAIINKKSELSLVTASDQKAEDLIIGLIRKGFPDHSILAEESMPSGTSPCRWIIDPLDGTTNFAHTYPVACVSIAYEESGVVQVGGIYDPFRDELFFAEKGKGATLNKKPIHVSLSPSLNDSLIATGFPYDRREKMDEYLPVFKEFVVKVQGIRRCGAAAIDICYVACGRFDGYWECKLNPWDKAAALLILHEAGGRSSNFSGETLSLEDTQNVASNSLIHDEMLEVLKPYQNVAR